MIPPAPVVEPAPAIGTWRVRGRELALDRPRILGILNVTPDSFSDGGKWLDPAAAVDRARAMLAEGADAIDIGGESTRPQGARPVDADEELRRVLPVIDALRRLAPDAIITVDTVKSLVAERALETGAHAVNDVSAFRLDPRMAAVCGAAGAGVILMHSRGGVSTMGTYQDAAYGDDAVGEIIGELKEAVSRAVAAGISDASLVLDPGVGFSKRSEHSLAALAQLPRLTALGYPVLVGVSRKRFIGEITGTPQAPERVFGTVGANVAALALGARLFRVHDVRENRHALDVAWRILRARQQ